MAETNAEENLVALKYLELARGEILERLKLSNQFLIVYLGGISALIGWLFSGNSSAQSSISPRDALPAVALGLSFLACSLSWILNENERMIEGLAKYQTEALKKWANQFPFLMWEGSEQLSKEVPRYGAMMAHTVIINLPSGVVILCSIIFPGPKWNPSLWVSFLVGASIITCLSCWVSFNMIHRRELHRHKS